MRMKVSLIEQISVRTSFNILDEWSKEEEVARRGVKYGEAHGRSRKRIN